MNKSADFQKLCDINFSVSHITSNRARPNMETYNFICKKSMRKYDRLFYVIKGEVTYNSETGNIIVGTSGDILYFPNDITYVCSWNAELPIDFITVEFILESYDNHDLISLSDDISIVAKDCGLRLYNLFDELVTNWNMGNTGYHIKTLSLFYNILYELNKFQRDDYLSAEHESIRNALIYIGNHYTEEIYVSDLAKISNMCESKFRREFKAYTHTSPIKYQNGIRINKAIALMKSGYYSIGEISNMIGCCDQSYFNRIFKSVTTMNPTEYICRQL